MDRIFIRDLVARCIVGVNPRERRQVREVVVGIVLETDFSAAGRSDRLAQTVDYSALRDRVADVVEGSRFRLLEALAEAIATVCLEHPRVTQVQVAVEKPGALAGVRSVGVEIVRRRT